MIYHEMEIYHSTCIEDKSLARLCIVVRYTAFTYFLFQAASQTVGWRREGVETNTSGKQLTVCIQP